MRRSGTMVPLLAVLMSLVLAGQALGVTWSTPFRLAADRDASLMHGQALATAAGATHVVYDNAGLRYRRSTDLGGSWSKGIPLAPDTATTSAGDYAVAAYGSLVAVAYSTYSTTGARSLYVRRSTDKGVHWLPRQTLASYFAEAQMGSPSIAIGKAGVHVVWTDGRTGRIYYRRSTDGGATFTARVALALTTRNLSPATRDGYPVVAASGLRVYVAWSPANAADHRCTTSLAMRRSVDGGQSFRRTQAIDGRMRSDIHALSASGSVLLASYTLCDGHVVVARSADGGATLVTRSIAGTKTTAYWWNDIDLSGSTARLVYATDSPSYDDRVLVRTSTDAGSTWASAAAMASGTDLMGPSVVGNASSVLVVYAKLDNTSGMVQGVFTRKGAL